MVLGKSYTRFEDSLAKAVAWKKIPKPSMSKIALFFRGISAQSIRDQATSPNFLRFCLLPLLLLFWGAVLFSFIWTYAGGQGFRIFMLVFFSLVWADITRRLYRLLAS